MAVDPGAGQPGPQIVTVSQPDASQAVVEILTTPAGVATTLESLHFEIQMHSGFADSPPFQPLIVLEYVDQFGNIVYSHAIVCPDVD